uniref:Cdk5 and Abl enzyme substrate 2 n=1 Tax=Pavo cristatus TaxID=9049 RepID=A0A8C9FJ05_PAVCR
MSERAAGGAALRAAPPGLPRRSRLIRRMAAAAACGSPAPRPPREQPAPPPRKRGDSRRRQAALFFLNNISLDGRPPSCPEAEKPPPPPAGPGEAEEAVEPAGAPPRLLSPPAGLALEVQRQSVWVLSYNCRTKHISGSPRHKNLKKMHFIKNMRQYDTKNSRIVLICAKRTLCVAFSILPYGESLRISDLKMDGQKQRHPSGGVSVSTEMVLGMEGVELGADGKVVSYAKFLYPTNALVVRKADSHSAVPSCRAGASRSLPGSRYKPVTAKMIPAGAEIGKDGLAEYDPNLLDDPQWPCGKHKRVLIFASYMTTVIEYVKPSDLKKDMNETFREKFPHIKLTLSKIRSLKREMRNLSEECNLEPVTVSMAYVYFEKLVLQGKLNKQNRKLCAGACVLLAAKISSDLRKHEVKHLIDVSTMRHHCITVTVLIILAFVAHLNSHLPAGARQHPTAYTEVNKFFDR